MLFVDEDVRQKFYSKPALLQIVCELLESGLFQYHYHLNVYNVHEIDGNSIALAAIEHVTPDALMNLAAIKYAVSNLDLRFERKDGAATVSHDPDDPTLVRVLVSKAADLAEPL